MMDLKTDRFCETLSIDRIVLGGFSILECADVRPLARILGANVGAGIDELGL